MNPKIKKVGVLFMFVGVSFLLTSPALSAEVWFDGLYVYKEGPIYNYLRFYPDGTVISVSCSDSVEEAARWFSRADWRGDVRRKVVSKGTYAITGSQIKFTTMSETGPFDYDGHIAGEIIELTVYSYYAKKHFREKYEFAEVDVCPD